MQPNELKAYQKHKGLRYFSKEEFREIYANGKYEGKLEGRIEGKREGKREGKLEGAAMQRRLTILNAFNKGYAVPTIADLMEIPEATVIEELKNQGLI
jgi:predicted transposase YdaD